MGPLKGINNMKNKTCKVEMICELMEGTSEKTGKAYSFVSSYINVPMFGGTLKIDCQPVTQEGKRLLHLLVQNAKE